ncbi:dTDP-4-amino-4,6-dideoxygalactose transaminase [Chitinophaga sp. Hz27]|uniref:dTDP-4-amino-4,6-dideoxygalactose transaminase n=1 Tax=Chitinophaga sp. Hz27 TaxID=3347169 RepID=UPI0035DF3963
MINTLIPFNKPYLTGKEAHYIYQAVYSGKISGNGVYTKKCQAFFEERYGFRKTLLTTSCTDALEMAAILANIQPGDEVIVPSYTFVSSAIAFIREGAKIVFADSGKNNPNMDADALEELITEKTRVIVPVHYAGIACDMDKIMALADKYNLLVIEDAAQAIDAFYKGRPLGSIGHMAAFSFHETKNIISGEGGMLVVNDPRFAERAEIIWEKGTNRAQFFRGEVNKYGWVDTGSSFLPSEIVAAFLYAQLENLDAIQHKRKEIWEMYAEGLAELAAKGELILPEIPDYATNNAHMFYIVCNDLQTRSNLITYLKERNVFSVFHYLSLHKSEYNTTVNPLQAARVLPASDNFTDCLLRLPFYFELSKEDVTYIINTIKTFFDEYAD